MRLGVLSGAHRLFWSLLFEGGLTGEALVDAALGDDAEAGGAVLYYHLALLDRKCLLRYTLLAEGRAVATLEPFSAAFAFRAMPSEGRFRLSRFACLRRDGDDTVLESPLGHGRLLLHDAWAVAAALAFVGPETPAVAARRGGGAAGGTPASAYGAPGALGMDGMDGAAAGGVAVRSAQVGAVTGGTLASACGVPGADAEVLVEALCTMMHGMGALFPCDGEGRLAEDVNDALRQWEFHDLFFHSRSRCGRHGNPSGGVSPFRGAIAPLPAVKAPMSAERIVLHRPGPEELCAPGEEFFAVAERRRSLRDPGARPVTAAELGVFLFCTGAVRKVLPADPVRGLFYEATLRPCIAGGAVHELEFYLTVARCDGIDPGFYHYDPLLHELERLGPLDALQELLLEHAQQGMGGRGRPDVLCTMAARFQRIAWKYRSIAYALILKDVGAVMQHMCLVATALRLVPCALGAGDAEVFARASGLDGLVEGPVGEFVLSGSSGGAGSQGC